MQGLARELAAPGVRSARCHGGAQPAQLCGCWQGYGFGIEIQGSGQLSVVPAVFGAPFKSVPRTTAPSRRPSDVLACSALPAGSLAGTVAVVDRGTCHFTVKAKNVQDAGAVRAAAGAAARSRRRGLTAPTRAQIMLLILDPSSGDLDSPGGEDATVTIPVVMGRAADAQAVLGGSRVRAALRWWAPLIARPQMLTYPVDASDGTLNENHMAAFSSVGPAPDGRLKPDITAPVSSALRQPVR
jgi:hypothetical protein